MKAPAEMPPTWTVEREPAVPRTPDPTSAQLKRDIDSGRTGDKIGVFDPAASPLATDDEAAGRPPSGRQVQFARYVESIRRWSQGGRPKTPAHDRPDIGGYGFIAFTTLIGLIVVVGVAWVR